MTATVTRLPDRWTTDEDIPAGYLSSVELIKRTGITYRQLDYWTRTGLVTPANPRGATPGSGSFRLYPVADAARLGAVKTLLDAGLSLQTIRDVIDEVVDTGTVRLGRGDHSVVLTIPTDL